MTNCNKCLDNEHEHVCDCGHAHSDHVYASGCTHKDRHGKQCQCECYSQKKLLKAS